jgi:hypothetical protein
MRPRGERRSAAMREHRAVDVPSARLAALA